MEDARASETAKGVALLRAFHLLVDGEPKILHDPLSARLLHPNAIAWMRQHAAEHQTPAARDLRSHVVTRSRFSEDALESPPNLSWAPIDFERESLGDGLRRAGFDDGAPAFFSCLGACPT